MTLGPFQFGALSVPFLGSAAVVLVMALYVMLMRGAPLLRGAFLLLVLCILPLVVNTALVSATNDEWLATWLFRVAYAPVPLAGTGVLLFLLVLTDRVRAHAGLLLVSAAIAIGIGAIALLTPWVAPGVWRVPAGLLVQRGTVWSALTIAVTGVQVGVGATIALRHLRSETSPKRRRQCIGALAAFSISMLGGFDVLLAFGIGWFPVAWFFLTVGPLIALRALVVDDLLHASAVDRRALYALPYLGVAGAGVWLLVGMDLSPGLLLAGILALFVILRAAIGIGRFLAVAEVATDSPLERGFERYAAQLQTLRTEHELATTTADVLRLTCGCERFALAVPAGTTWRLADGSPAPAAPDAALAVHWLAAEPALLQRDSVPLARAELRAPLERLFHAYDAEALALLASSAEVVGLMAIGQLPGERALRPDEAALIGRVAGQLTGALEHQAMVRDAHVRAALKKEVGLAAAVQEAFIPGRELLALDGLQLCGGYEAATQCGGDWWSAHPLPDGRTLVLIGDVTGHGLAAGMLTAAARGCIDVLLRLRRERFDLLELVATLDAVVRRRGGGSLHMTCFATLVDPHAKQLSFVNAGHNLPYVVAPDGAALDVLAARGDPLGARARAALTVHTRPIAAGDLVVWYTDGLVECLGPDQRPWGDRRFQRALRGLGARDEVGAIRDRLLAESAAHRAGVPAADDVTLVVGRVC